MKRVLLVALFVVLAGCSSLPGTTTEPAGPASTTDDAAGVEETATTERPTRTHVSTTPVGAADSSSTTATDSPSSTVTPTTPGAVEPADNPWRKDTVTVALVEGGHEGIDYRRPLSAAIDYWNENARYGEYTVEFVHVADAEDADIRVEIRESVDSCGVERSDRVLGCAPLLTDDTRADPPEDVLVEAGYDVASTEDIMIHEFGHVLGIRHGEEPEEYMRPNETVYRTAQPNATERAYPWETTEFRVFAVTDDLRESDRDDAREQVGHAIDYYDRITDEDDDVPANVTVGRADNRSDANVVVEFPDQLPGGGTRGSSIQQFGYDPDGDGAMEYYTNVTVSLVDIDTDAVGWHTGYWFGQALGIDESDLPEPFRDADPGDDWWTESP